jgi:hypothetical protein
MEAHQEFAREQYSFELERKDRLNGEASFVLTALGISASILSYVISRIDTPFSWWEGTALALLCLSLFASGKVLWHFWALLRGYEYEYVSVAPKILAYHEQLKSDESGSPGEWTAAEVLADTLAAQYAQAAQTNRICNVAKSGLLLKMKRTLFLAICPAVLAGLLLATSSWLQGGPSPKVLIEVKI